MLQSWWEVIAEFSFDPVYLPGIMNVLPDHLSRLYDELRVSDMLSDPILNGDKLKPNAIMSKQVLLTSLRTQPLHAFLLANKAFRLKADVLDELVLRPNDELVEFIQQRLNKRCPEESDRSKLLEDAHIASGHQAAEKMYNHLWHTDSVFWPTMRDDCCALVAKCIPCIQYNVRRQGYKPLSSIYVIGPWHHLSIDCGQMPPASDYNYFLVVVCLMTGFTRVLPLFTKHASATALALVTIFKQLGWPAVLQSDNGSEFDNVTLRSIVREMNVDHRFVIPYNPQANGTAENAVKAVKAKLHKLSLKPDAPAWPDLLPEVEESINVTPNVRTKTSPFVLMFNRSAFPLAREALEDLSHEEMTVITDDEYKKRSKILRTVIWPVIADESNRRKQHNNALVDDRRQQQGQLISPESIPLQSEVMVVDPTRSELNKHAPKYIQKIFRVVSKTDGDNFRLMDVSNQRMYHRPVHLRDLLKVRDPVAADSFFQVESILDYKGHPPNRQYLVRWKNCPASEATWEPSSAFDDDPDWLSNWESSVDEAKARARAALAERRKQRSQASSQ